MELQLLEFLAATLDFTIFHNTFLLASKQPLTLLNCLEDDFYWINFGLSTGWLLI